MTRTMAKARMERGGLRAYAGAAECTKRASAATQRRSHRQPRAGARVANQMPRHAVLAVVRPLVSAAGAQSRLPVEPCLLQPPRSAVGASKMRTATSTNATTKAMTLRAAPSLAKSTRAVRVREQLRALAVDDLDAGGIAARARPWRNISAAIGGAHLAKFTQCGGSVWRPALLTGSSARCARRRCRNA